MIITKDNFVKLYPRAIIRFDSIMNGPFVPQRKMNKPGSNRQIRYLEPKDLVKLSNKRIEMDKSYRAVKNKPKWLYLIKRSNELIEQDESEQQPQ